MLFYWIVVTKFSTRSSRWYRPTSMNAGFILDTCTPLVSLFRYFRHFSLSLPSRHFLVADLLLLVRPVTTIFTRVATAIVPWIAFAFLSWRHDLCFWGVNCLLATRFLRANFKDETVCSVSTHEVIAMLVKDSKLCFSARFSIAPTLVEIVENNYL